MDFEKLDLLAQSLMKNRKAHKEREIGSVYYHGVRVSRLVLTLRQAVCPQDDHMDDTLRLAGLFHDLGKGIEPHERYGAALFREAMKDTDVPQGMVEDAARLIEAHCDRRPNEPVHDVWERLLQDADLLDHVGCYKVWMDFNYFAYKEESMETAYARMSKEIGRYEHVRDLLNFPVSTRISDEKFVFLKEFIARMEKESVGEVYNWERLKD